MEDIIKKQAYNIPHSSTTPSRTLSMHKNSHTISKTKPKIRIIHIFAPEIIKTDVGNFRELVQRLTGKPTDHHQNNQKICWKKPKSPRREEEPINTSSVHEKQVLAKKVEVRSTFLGLETIEKVKVRNTFLGLETIEKVKEEEAEEQILWNGANSSGFLNWFADFDGFIQEVGEFPLLPMDSSHQMHGFERSHQFA